MGGGHQQLRFVRKQIGEPLCPIDSIDRRVDRSDWASFVSRGTREREGGGGRDALESLSRGFEGAGEAS